MKPPGSTLKNRGTCATSRGEPPPSDLRITERLALSIGFNRRIACWTGVLAGLQVTDRPASWRRADRARYDSGRVDRRP